MDKEVRDAEAPVSTGGAADMKNICTRLACSPLCWAGRAEGRVGWRELRTIVQLILTVGQDNILRCCLCLPDTLYNQPWPALPSQSSVVSSSG